jgi:hypothetical protein
VRELRGEEKWARSILQRELGVAVEQHDDGSESGMYDLKVVYKDGKTAAVEITAAADAETIEFWNLMNTSGRWVVPDLAGGWAVHVEPSARVKEAARGVARPPYGLRKRGTPELRNQTPGLRR